VIVQADDLLALSTVAVCPTSTSAPPASVHPEIELAGERTRVLCDMAGAVDARALGDDHVGHLGHDELRDVDEALSLALGLEC
jgi:mRNA interferase MazF